MYTSSALSAPPPPYVPTPTYRSSHHANSIKRKKGISALPLHLIHRILHLTLDQRATPSNFWSDSEEERVRRIWALFRGLRGVNRVFWLVATSILRAMYLESYLSHIKPDYSSDPFPYESSHLDDPSLGDATLDASFRSVYEGRGRETAVFDRYIAVKVGQELRTVESSLSEEGEAVDDIFKRLQPTARIEDLLLTIPSQYIIPSFSSPNPPPRGLPLPQSHLSITLTPTWAQLYLHSHPLSSSRRGSRELVVEVRRIGTLEGTVKRIEDGLDDIQRRLVSWGGRVQ
ncbi:uncharacterized protein I303_106977 [Kwoniella dejecticola CBS 10117]|uniref:Uncharacterized protein n=1 Tax=Kwoniella dejecticola CBS 10117 TaxID=1296121 RepID=A0A1A5ZYC9_9TREE|nr:uncharacterized protein I303_06378 [Kwoniella dejecticola CBS 10117]OBR82821.1 hypothetical protein I303_06378 [Kwoniella dejecticola CBS 10117]